MSFGATTLERLIAQEALEVDIELIAILSGALHLFPSGILLAQSLDHFIKVSIADFDHRTLNLGTLDGSELNFGVDLEGSHKLQILARLINLRLNTGKACGVQVLLGNGTHITLTHQFAHDFIAYAVTVTLAHHGHGYPALAETIETNILRRVQKAGLDGLIDLRRRHLECDTALDLGGRFDGNLHE